MNIRNAVHASSVAMLLAGGTSLMSQVTTGALSGHVFDANGKPLANARVSLESPALFQPRVLKTDAKGEYRAQLLPVGNYSLHVSAESFMGKSAEGVRVGVGANLTLDFLLKAIKEQSAVVEVMGTVAAEAKTDDKVSSNFSAEDLMKLPTTRSFDGALALAPGVTGTGLETNIRGGTTSGQRGPNSGAGGYRQVLYRINGIDVKDDSGGSWDASSKNQLYEPLPDSIEDIQVVLSALNARNGRTMGGQVNVVTKSGGNEFEGTVRAFVDRSSWKTNTPHGPQLNPDGSPLNGLSDLEQNAGENFNRYTDVTFSGPIIKDKLWFYIGTRFQPSSVSSKTLGQNGVPYSTVTGEPTGQTYADVMKYPLLTWGTYPNVDNMLLGKPGYAYPAGYRNIDFKTDTDWLSTIPADTKYSHIEGKLTGQVTTDNSVALTYLYEKTTNGGMTGERQSDLSQAFNREFVGDAVTKTSAWSLDWNSTISQSWFLEARASKAEVKANDFNGPTAGHPTFIQDSLSTGDATIRIGGVDGTTYMGAPFYSQRSSSDITPRITGNLSYMVNLKTFQDAAGQHEVDFGGEFFQQEFQFGREREGNKGVFSGGLIYNPTTKDFLYPVFYNDSGYLVNTDVVPSSLANPELPLRGPSATMERYWVSQATAKNNSTGLWLNDTWSVNENWNIMAGLRYNQFTIKDAYQKNLADVNITEPRLQVKFNPDGKDREIYTFTFAKLASAYSDEMTNWIRSSGWYTRTVHPWKGIAGQPSLDNAAAVAGDVVNGQPMYGVRWVDYATLTDANNYGAPVKVIDLSQTAKTNGLAVPYAFETTIGYTRNYDTGSVRISLVQRAYKKDWVVFVHDGLYDPSNATKYLTLVKDPSGEGAPSQYVQTHRFINTDFTRYYRGVELSWTDRITSRLTLAGNYTYSLDTGRHELDYYNYRDEKLLQRDANGNLIPQSAWSSEGVLNRNQVAHLFLTYTYPIGKGNVSASILANYGTGGVRDLYGTRELTTRGNIPGQISGKAVNAIDWDAGQNVATSYNLYYGGLGAYTRGSDEYSIDMKLQGQIPLAGRLSLVMELQISNLFNRILRTSVYDWGSDINYGGNDGTNVPIGGRPLSSFNHPWGYAAYGGNSGYYTDGRTFTNLSVGLKF